MNNHPCHVTRRSPIGELPAGRTVALASPLASALLVPTNPAVETCPVRSNSAEIRVRSRLYRRTLSAVDEARCRRASRSPMVSEASRRWAHMRTLLTTVLIEVVLVLATLAGITPRAAAQLIYPDGETIASGVGPVYPLMATYGPKPTTAPAGAIILHPGDDISAIVSTAPIGATFYFEPGIYRGVSLIPKNGQTFIGAEGAILNGSAVLAGFTRQGNLWVIGGQTQKGVRHATGEGDGVSMRPGYPETVFINDTPLKPVDSLSKIVAGTFYFDYAADEIYIADNPTGQKVEAGKLANACGGNAQNVTVQNLVIEKYNPPVQSGAVQGNKGWIIQDNEVRLNYAVGIKVEPGENSKIIGNYVHDNGELGLGGSGDNMLIEGNEIAKNGFWSGIDVLWEGGGFKFANTDGLIVRGNYSHDNHGPGMWTDINNINTLYENNLVVHNTHIGITHEISYGAVIRNNTLIGNGYGDKRGWLWGAEIQIQNSKNVEAYGNRIDMTGGGNGVVLIQQDRGRGTYGPYVTTGNHIHDNVIVDHDSTGKIGGVADYNWAGMANGGNTWSNNQYYMPDVGNRFWWGGEGLVPNAGEYNFIQFKTYSGESGSISQGYPNIDNWLDGTPADTRPQPTDTTPPDTNPRFTGRRFLDDR
jgi:hypothetical protein